MSSIERAMDKILGEDNAPGEAKPASAASVSLDESGMAQASPTAVAVPQPKLEEPPRVAADPDRAPPPAGESSAAAPGTPAPVAKVTRKLEAERAVTLDFTRLAAAGFLTPNQATTRQSEEYQHIKRRLLNNISAGIQGNGLAPNLILITSSVPSEGKTFTSVNLAISIAMELDHTVLLIDTDIMKRDTSRVLGVSDRKGLFDLLANPELRLEDLLVRTSMKNLVLLPVGTPRDGSTELLASVRMRELTREIAARYPDRVVLFDSPPVLATTTATALAPLVGQLVLVAEAGSTKQETIKETLQRLDRVTITGVILNKSKQVTTASYDYYGYYHSR